MTYLCKCFTVFCVDDTEADAELRTRPHHCFPTPSICIEPQDPWIPPSAFPIPYPLLLHSLPSRTLAVHPRQSKFLYTEYRRGDGMHTSRARPRLPRLPLFSPAQERVFAPSRSGVRRTVQAPAVHVFSFSSNAMYGVRHHRDITARTHPFESIRLCVHSTIRPSSHLCHSFPPP